MRIVDGIELDDGVDEPNTIDDDGFGSTDCSQEDHCGHLDDDDHLICCDCGKRTVEKLSEHDQILALRIRFRNHGKFSPEND
jgi:hypothetical protein